MGGPEFPFSCSKSEALTHFQSFPTLQAHSEEARRAVFKNHEVIHKRSNRRPGVLPINIYHILVCTGHQC